MTLLEVLIIVVILALAYGTLANGLLTHSESSQQRLALMTWKELDGTARQMAISENRAVTLELAPDEMTAHCRTVLTAEQIVSRTLLTPLTLQGSADTKVLDTVQIDGRGCSEDYLIRAAMRLSTTSESWKVLGLTGQWIEIAAGGGSQ